MKRKDYKVAGAAIILVGLIGFGTAPSESAETRVSGDELQTLLSGNTGEGKFIKWDTTYKAYFEATGRMFRIDSLNNRERPQWYINKEGELCIKGKHKENCHEVKKREDGGYNLYLSNDLKWTIDKIVPGNPNNLYW